MDLLSIQKALEEDRVKFTGHGTERLQARNITIDDVENCIKTGEIIEDYPEDYPFPSCLIFGYGEDNGIIHVVVGFDENMIYIITAYKPDTIKFEEDLKTRRKKNE